MTEEIHKSFLLFLIFFSLEAQTVGLTSWDEGYARL